MGRGREDSRLIDSARHRNDWPASCPDRFIPWVNSLRIPEKLTVGPTDRQDVVAKLDTAVHVGTAVPAIQPVASPSTDWAISARFYMTTDEKDPLRPGTAN
jgi:hypothetical protein